MPDGLPDPGKIWNDFITNPLVQTAGTLIVIYVVLLWLGTAYWAFRDMQARSENPILPYFASALIISSRRPLPRWCSIIVRPRVAGGGLRAPLAEESLLAEVEERAGPVCRDRVHADWLVCPNCRTRLHRVCPRAAAWPIPSGAVRLLRARVPASGGSPGRARHGTHRPGAPR
jgi:hypothetical protein